MLQDDSTVLQEIPVTFEAVEAVVNKALECSEDYSYEVRRTNRIFSMVQRLYGFHTEKLLNLSNERDAVKFKRKRFYEGKAPSEDYQKEPLRESILKSDIESWMKVDKYVLAINRLYAEQERIVKYLEEANSMVSSRRYLLNTAVAHQKLQLGAL